MFEVIVETPLYRWFVRGDKQTKPPSFPFTRPCRRRSRHRRESAYLHLKKERRNILAFFNILFFPANNLRKRRNSRQFLQGFQGLARSFHFRNEYTTAGRFAKILPFDVALFYLVFFVLSIFPEKFSFFAPFYLTIIAFCYILYSEYSVLLSGRLKNMSIESFQKAFELELLLRNVHYTYKGQQAEIHLNPYEEIKKALNFLYADKPSLRTNISIVFDYLEELKGKNLEEIQNNQEDNEILQIIIEKLKNLKE